MRVMLFDLIIWFMGYVLEVVDDDGFEVDVVGVEFEDFELLLLWLLIVICIDFGFCVDWMMFDCFVGVFVFGGLKNVLIFIVDFVCWFVLVLFDDEFLFVIGSFIVWVDFSGCNGLYVVFDEFDVVCQYMMVQYVVEGFW